MAEEEKKEEVKEQDAVVEPKKEEAKQAEEQDQVSALMARCDNIESRISAIEEALEKAGAESDEGQEAGMQKEEEKKEEVVETQQAKHSKEYSELQTEVKEIKTMLAQFMNQGVKRTIPSGQQVARDPMDAEVEAYMSRFLK